VDTTIADIIARRRIKEVVHFTTNLGFLGCLAKGSVLPRSRLPKEKLLEHILTLNAPFRTENEPWFDKTKNWTDYVNLSISDISTNLYRHSLGWHAGKNIFWLIMSFDPLLMEEAGVYFCTTNNIYALTSRGTGADGLEALFAQTVPRKHGWTASRGNRAQHLPTCEQAEVLYPDGLSLSYLRKVYVGEGEQSDWVYSVLAQYGQDAVEIVIDKAKFQGVPN